MPTIACVRCATEFHVSPFRQAYGRKYCSRACSIPGAGSARRRRVVIICPICTASREVTVSHAKAARTCGSTSCLREHQRQQMLGNQRAVGTVNHSAFKPGQAAWNKGLRGRHFSPNTEFQSGNTPANHLPVGSVTIRTAKRSGEQRAFVKIAEPNLWRLRALVTWETRHGPIPKGKLVHHRDRNPLNDDPGNLELQTRAQHLLEHRAEFEAKRKVALQQRQTARRHSQFLPNPSQHTED